ncbi:MAG: hypothetical protein AAF587_34570 [Bacteroidota bacterium]
MKKIAGILLMVSIIGCTGSKIPFSERIPVAEKSQFIQLPKDWRNLRYGEIIPVFKDGPRLYLEVYNTMGSNELPQELWEKLNTEQMAKEYRAKKVILNGPRYWVVNQIEARGKSSDGKVVNFGGIEMTLRATIEKDIFDGDLGSKLYEENQVKRETTYHFLKDNMVYELTSPTGDVYRMQSYAQIVDPDLTIEQLETLDERLSPPEGWSYQARRLAEDETLTVNGIAYVISDDLGNSYQKIIQ